MLSHKNHKPTKAASKTTRAGSKPAKAASRPAKAASRPAKAASRFPSAYAKRHAPRVVALTAAAALNLALLAALMMPSFGPSARPLRPSEGLVVVFAETTSRAPLRAPRNADAQLRRVRLSIQPPMLNLPIPTGPPTETRAALLRNLVPDREAAVVAAPVLRTTCHSAFPGEFTSETAFDEKIVLRVFVMPDGRIGQGTVTGTSGDARLDSMTLRCLQMYAHLETDPDDPESTGSWQLLTWKWAFP